MKDLRSSGDTLTFVRYKIRHDSKPRVIPFAPTQQSDESPEVPVNRQRLSLSFRLAEKNSIVGENTFKQSTRPFNWLQRTRQIAQFPQPCTKERLNLFEIGERATHRSLSPSGPSREAKPHASRSARVRRDAPGSCSPCAGPQCFPRA